MKALTATTAAVRRAHAWVIARAGGPANRDRGAEVIQFVIITAGVALIALLVIAAIKGGVGKFLDVINGLNPS